MIDQIVFSHANGFPTKCYSHFFEQLSEFTINGIPMSGNNLKSIEIGWESLCDELISFIVERHNRPVIGLGHSMGAVFMLMAAKKRPELFEQVILMDPPIMGKEQRGLIAKRQQDGKVHEVLSVAQKAKIRKENFPSMELVERVMKGKGLFQQFHPTCFNDYLNGAFTSMDDDTVTLTYPKNLEYTIFCTIPPFAEPFNILPPVHYIYATSGEIFESRLDGIEELKTIIPSAQFIPFEGGHLFPFEQPSEVANLIKRLLKGSN